MEGCSFVLSIISKVTNAVNTRDQPLNYPSDSRLSSARFNHHTARINTSSIHSQLCSTTQSTNQSLHRFSDRTGAIRFAFLLVR